MKAKLIRLGPTNIDKYIDKVWNWESGCCNQADGRCPPIPCYAGIFVNRMAQKKNTPYPNGFKPTVYPEAFLSPLSLPKNKSYRIGVGFMGDIFCAGIDPFASIGQETKNETITLFKDCTLQNAIFSVIRLCPRHTFVFLTKNISGMRAWGKFPANCEVGFSATNEKEFIERLVQICKIQAKVYWCSLEPLLGWQVDSKSDAFGLLDWVALGALTGTRKNIFELAPQYPALTPFKLSARGNLWGLMPPVAWLKNIVEQCSAAGTKVWLKDNLGNWLDHSGFNSWAYKDATSGNLRQECGARKTQIKIYDEFHAAFPDNLVIPTKGAELSDEELNR
jgi:hypothetical protein